MPLDDLDVLRRRVSELERIVEAHDEKILEHIKRLDALLARLEATLDSMDGDECIH